MPLLVFLVPARLAVNLAEARIKKENQTQDDSLNAAGGGAAETGAGAGAGASKAPTGIVLDDAERDRLLALEARMADDEEAEWEVRTVPLRHFPLA